MADPTGKEAEASGLWLRSALRIWCVGGWRYQLKGGEVRRLTGPSAEEGLARHLAVRYPRALADHALQKLLSRKRGEPIPKQSLHVAANRLRSLLAEAAPDAGGAKKLSKHLLPHARAATAADGSRASMYRLGENVWVDLIHARDPLAFYPLPVDRDDSALGGGTRARAFVGFEPLAFEANGHLTEPSRPSGSGLPKHLSGFTPPIGRLADLVPPALDRLLPGSMLVIQGKGESGRLHLAEAIELGALAWCDRGAEQIRERPDDVPPSDSATDFAQPRHLYILDLTRELTKPQEERLLAVRAQAGQMKDPDQRPSLLVVTDGSPIPRHDGLAGWTRTETISLPPPRPDEVEEAYMIATRELPSTHKEREAEFAALAAEYKQEHDLDIGFRAASSAASIAIDEARAPRARELPSPDVNDPPLEELKGDEHQLARALAWFGNDPFTLADARAATSRPDLPRSEIFRIATKIPGGGAGTYEIHPRLLEAKPPPEVWRRICEYLLEEGREEAIGRWPWRATQILSSKSVDLGMRMRLAPKLIELSRDIGFAKDLQKRMQALLKRSEQPEQPEVMRVAIGRARLLTYLGRLGQAEKALEPIADGRRAGKQHKQLKGEAHLRLAIVASRRGNRDVANGRAKRAAQLSPELEARVERYYAWEALYTARFEPALRMFQNESNGERDLEHDADAAIGTTLALLRLGRLKEAEATLQGLDVTVLRRMTRNRVIRAAATARFLRKGPRAGIEILDEALGRDESRAHLQSADLLEARAYLHATLGGDALVDADRDLAHAKGLLTTEDEWQKAALYYIRGLIDEAKMRATPHSAEEFRARAKRNATKSIEAASANPWNQARAHTLLGRLEIDDGEQLSRQLREAASAHRRLDALCPDALRETLDLGAVAAGAWRMRDTQRELERLVAELAPQDVPVDPGREAALVTLEEVANVVERNPRPEAAGDGRKANVKVLGSLGNALLAGGAEALARGKPVSLRLLQPRSTTDLAAGVYELDPSTGDLLPLQDMTTKPMAMLRGAANRRFVEQRLGAVLLVGIGAGDPGDADPIFLGQWLETFRAETRKRGIASIESLPIEPRAVDALGLKTSLGFLALGLADLPALG